MSLAPAAYSVTPPVLGRRSGLWLPDLPSLLGPQGWMRVRRDIHLRSGKNHPRRNNDNTRQRRHAPTPTHAGGEKMLDRTTTCLCSAQVVYRDGAGALWGRKDGPPDSYLEPLNPHGSPFFFGFQKPFFFQQESKTGFKPSPPSLHITEWEWFGAGFGASGKPRPTNKAVPCWCGGRMISAPTPALRRGPVGANEGTPRPTIEAAPYRP